MSDEEDDCRVDDTDTSLRKIRVPSERVLVQLVKAAVDMDLPAATVGRKKMNCVDQIVIALNQTRVLADMGFKTPTTDTIIKWIEGAVKTRKATRVASRVCLSSCLVARARALALTSNLSTAARPRARADWRRRRRTRSRRRRIRLHRAR